MSALQPAAPDRPVLDPAQPPQAHHGRPSHRLRVRALHRGPLVRVRERGALARPGRRRGGPAVADLDHAFAESWGGRRAAPHGDDRCRGRSAAGIVPARVICGRRGMSGPIASISSSPPPRAGRCGSRTPISSRPPPTCRRWRRLPATGSTFGSWCGNQRHSHAPADRPGGLPAVDRKRHPGLRVERHHAPRQDRGLGRTLVKGRLSNLNLSSWATNWELDLVVEDEEFGPPWRRCTSRISPTRPRSCPVRHPPAGREPEAPARPPEGPHAPSAVSRPARSRSATRSGPRRSAPFAYCDGGQEHRDDRRDPDRTRGVDRFAPCPDRLAAGDHARLVRRCSPHPRARPLSADPARPTRAPTRRARRTD